MSFSITKLCVSKGIHSPLEIPSVVRLCLFDVVMRTQLCGVKLIFGSISVIRKRGSFIVICHFYFIYNALMIGNLCDISMYHSKLWTCSLCK